MIMRIVLFMTLFQSTHLMRGATVQPAPVIHVGQFQSTHLMRGATRQYAPSARRKIFQSTHLMRGATVNTMLTDYELEISIHAPHARCDCRCCRIRCRFIISIHAPHARCDRRPFTPAVPIWNFNPRTSCEVRLYRQSFFHRSDHFNPRTSCEVRLFQNFFKCHIIRFQSTHLMRGAT